MTKDEAISQLRAALIKVKPIVGSACASAKNHIRPLRDAAYQQLCDALEATKDLPPDGSVQPFYNISYSDGAGNAVKGCPHNVLLGWCIHCGDVNKGVLMVHGTTR